MALHNGWVRSIEEFGRMTPGLLMALIERYNVDLRRMVFANGITASMVANVNRKRDSEKIWAPLDFVHDPSRNLAREKLKENVSALFGMIVESKAHTVFDMDGVRSKVIANLQKAGYTKVEEIVDEVFHAWKLQRNKKAPKEKK